MDDFVNTCAKIKHKYDQLDQIDDWSHQTVMSASNENDPMFFPYFYYMDNNGSMPLHYWNSVEDNAVSEQYPSQLKNKHNELWDRLASANHINELSLDEDRHNILSTHIENERFKIQQENGGHAYFEKEIHENESNHPHFKEMRALGSKGKGRIMGWRADPSTIGRFENDVNVLINDKQRHLQNLKKKN